MRVLRLAVDERRVVDLHPSLSIVTGLDATQARALRRAVASIAAGLAPAGAGLLEAHGLLLDAGQADLDLLDLGTGPVESVVTPATALDDASGGPSGDGRQRLRAAERDVELLATDRRWAARARAATLGDVTGGRTLRRAEALGLALAAHDGTDVEPLRRACDADRDAQRAGGDAGRAVIAALATLGIHLDSDRVPADEARRVAEDLLDEHRRHAAWATGARVELDGLERGLRARLAPGSVTGGATAALLPESGARRAERADAALADAVARADDLRCGCPPPDRAPAAHELEWALLRRLTDRPRDHPAGTVPILVDHVLTRCDDADVERILGRLEPLSRGVQVLLVEDHPAATAWARAAGTGRAAVVTATPAPPGGTAPTMRPSPT